ncbi:hypothetical protein SUGI_0211580 [Cryptomeria japonica]|nr:hypothetical protein SUGI_0211580 [Cryptomeria japonica]
MGGLMLEKRVLNPIRRIWRNFSKRFFTAHKKSNGLHILYEDVKSCNDEDVNVLWSILVNLHKNTHYADGMAGSSPGESNPSTTT